MRKYRQYSDNDIINYSKQTYSIAQLLIKLDLKPSGGNYLNIKRLLQKLKVNTSHWKGQSWSKGQQLKDWSKYSHPKCFRKHLLKERNFKCESCSRKIWNKKQSLFALFFFHFSFVLHHRAFIPIFALL